VEEQYLWRSFDNSDIYEFITREPDCLPGFQFNWIEPCQLTVHLPPGVILAQPRHQQPPPDPTKLPAIPPVHPAPAPDQLLLPPPEAAPPPIQNQQAPGPEPVAGPSSQQGQQPPHQHDLRPRPEVNYKELHTGVKKKCHSLQRKVKVVITRLAPGSFSQKPPPMQLPPNTDNPGPSS
jgi:hypothetical protein